MMLRSPSESVPKRLLELPDLQRLIESLKADGHVVVGPVVRDGVVVYDEIASVDEMPAGWKDEQGAGSYRLSRRDDAALFAHIPGAQTWKRFLYPPRQRLFQTRRGEDGRIGIAAEEGPPPRFAFLGVRPCELAAIAVQDRVLLEGPYADAGYEGRRRGVFVAAVQCTEPGGTCFCASMGTGPRAHSGFDLALTEVVTKDRHGFLVEVGTERGRELILRLGCREATAEETRAAEQRLESAAGRMGRELATKGLRERLQGAHDDPRWERTASRCLGCANCTLVCPTCFCSTVEDRTDLGGGLAERVRRWDSCFNLDFSYIHGGSIRTSTASRYRHWLLHKLGTWHDQFGTSGCVGCGRCITWCPAGIDITQEAAAVGTNAAATASGG